MLGLTIRSQRDGTSIYDQVSIDEAEVVVVDIKSSATGHARRPEFVGIGSDAFSRACGNIHRKHTLQRHGADCLTIGQCRISTIGQPIIGQPIIENGESGFAYI